MDCSPPGSSVRGDSPGKSTRVACHALLQGIFPTQGLNLSLCIAGRFFTTEPPGKPQPYAYMNSKWVKQWSKNKAITSTIFLYRRIFSCPNGSFGFSCMMLWENPNKSFGQPNTYYCWDGEVFLCVIRILKVMWKKKKKKKRKKVMWKMWQFIDSYK